MKYDTQQVIDKILFGEIDFGIVGAKKDSKQLTYLEILGDEIVLIANPSNEFVEKGFVTMNDFNNMNLILREIGSGTRTSSIKFLEENDINIENLNIIAEVESNETIKKFVELGMGLSLVSKRSIEDELLLGKLKIVPIKDKIIERKFYFVYHKKRVLSPLSETFKSFLIEKI
jgi:DNA-binding transcriptional LysR family regulator